MKKTALVIAQEGFRDEEYFIPKKVLEGKGVIVDTVSLKKGRAVGKLGAVANADVSISEVDPLEYDGIFFVGGPGASVYFQDAKAHDILRISFANGKIIGAICAGPAVLAYAGLLKGKRATSFSGVRPILEQSGAVFTGKNVEVDGNIITSDGPVSAEKFGLTIAAALNSNN